MREDPFIFEIFHLWKYNIILNRHAKRIVEEKFKNILLQLCKEENIKINYFNTIEELSESCQSYSKDKERIVGLYGYSVKKDSIEFIYDDVHPFISLTNNYDVFTFAHEIGHHFSLKYNYDRTETSADNYIFTLAKKYLTDIEIFILSIELEVYSKANFSLPRIKRKQWRKFKKEHNL